MKTYYELTPQDAWFFRDGRPYNKTETNQADAVSQFPPSPRTITGAFRAALARANGWDGYSNWNRDSRLREVLGDGPDDLGALRFDALFLLKKEKEKEKEKEEEKPSLPFFPAPLHLLGKTNAEGAWHPAAFLRPGNAETLTDIGRVRLPEIAGGTTQRDGLKPAEKFWIAADGLKQALVGELPDASAFVSQNDLWKTESRVGLFRDEKTRVTVEGSLYSPTFIRLHKGVGLGVGIDRLPDGFAPPSLFPFGGESRLAICKKLLCDNPLPPAPVLAPDGGKISFAVIALSPLPAQPRAGISPLLNIGGATLVSACAGKPVFFGGWDSINKTPLPLKPFHPAGSVWFFQAAETELQKIKELHGNCLADKHLFSHGFGQIAIGAWPK
jgi:CRISPR-associated protein Cmr3